MIIDGGHGNEHLPLHTGHLSIPNFGLVLDVRPFNNRVLTYDRIFMAVELLQRCGYDKGFREEMWAYIFTPQGRVGLITMSMGRRPDELGTTGANVSISTS